MLSTRHSTLSTSGVCFLRPGRRPSRMRWAGSISQRVTRSRLDSATMLFDQELMLSALTLQALDMLASKCSSGSLSSVTATAVRNAQHSNSGVMEMLCVLAEVTFDELRVAADATFEHEAVFVLAGMAVRGCDEGAGWDRVLDE
jgi:hypothetical protein